MVKDVNRQKFLSEKIKVGAYLFFHSFFFLRLLFFFLAVGYFFVLLWLVLGVASIGGCACINNNYLSLFFLFFQGRFKGSDTTHPSTLPPFTYTMQSPHLRHRGRNAFLALCAVACLSAPLCLAYHSAHIFCSTIFLFQSSLGCFALHRYFRRGDRLWCTPSFAALLITLLAATALCVYESPAQSIVLIAAKIQYMVLPWFLISFLPESLQPAVIPCTGMVLGFPYHIYYCFRTLHFVPAVLTVGLHSHVVREWGDVRQVSPMLALLCIDVLMYSLFLSTSGSLMIFLHDGTTFPAFFFHYVVPSVWLTVLLPDGVGEDWDLRGITDLDDVSDTSSDEYFSSGECTNDTPDLDLEIQNQANGESQWMAFDGETTLRAVRGKVAERFGLKGCRVRLIGDGVVMTDGRLVDYSLEERLLRFSAKPGLIYSRERCEAVVCAMGVALDIRSLSSELRRRIAADDTHLIAELAVLLPTQQYHVDHTIATAPRCTTTILRLARRIDCPEMVTDVVMGLASTQYGMAVLLQKRAAVLGGTEVWGDAATTLAIVRAADVMDVRVSTAQRALQRHSAEAVLAAVEDEVEHRADDMVATLLAHGAVTPQLLKAAELRCRKQSPLSYLTGGNLTNALMQRGYCVWNVQRRRDAVCICVLWTSLFVGTALFLFGGGGEENGIVCLWLVVSFVACLAAPPRSLWHACWGGCVRTV